MSDRPTKRPKTRPAARQERGGAPTLASVLLPIVQQGFLGHLELGRLSQTSRQLKRQCDEELWKMLCCHLWPVTSQLSAIAISAHGGYSGWCRHMISPIREQLSEPPPLDRPSLRPEDVKILVNITRGGGDSFSSGLVYGDCLQKLFQQGWVSLTLGNPVVMGNAVCFLQGTCSCRLGCRFSADNFGATMHLYRSNGMTCRIYQSMKDDPCYCHPDGTPVRFPVDRSSGQWKESEGLHMYLEPGVPNEQLGLPLRWTPMAAEIHRRLGAAITFELLPIVRIIERDRKEVVAITRFQIATRKMPIGSNRAVSFECEKEAKNHGVTLLHILQELQGIDIGGDIGGIL